MAKKQAKKSTLPAVSKQTAGGIGGAVVGGMVAGPVGAIAGGVAGALVGKASAEGKQPIKRAVDTIRSKLRGSRVTKAVTSPTMSTGKPKKGPTPKKTAQANRAEKLSQPTAAKKKAKTAARSKGSLRKAK